MENDAENGEDSAVSSVDAQAELGRLLADPRFHLSDRNRAFLNYLAEASFGGQSKGVKAYSVAIDVFGRPSSFDPNTDPIVRIEATRLRTSLEQYYEAFGHETSIRIEVPRGSYIAQFHRTAAAEVGGAVEEIAVAERPTLPLSSGRNGGRLQFIAVVFGAIVVVLVGLLLAFQTLMPQGEPEIAYVGKPVVTLLGSISTDPGTETSMLEERVIAALARFENFKVIAEPAPGPARSLRRNAVHPGTGPRESHYEIVLRYRPEGDAPTLRWRVIDADSGEALATGEEKAKQGAASPTEALSMLADTIAIQLGADGGVLGSLEVRKDYPATAMGNICVLRGERALNRMDPNGITAARRCLEATIAADAENTDALATLARVLIAEDEITGQPNNVSRAVGYSNRAMATAPASPRSLIARMIVMNANGQHDAFRSAGLAALALNPLDAENDASFALRLYLGGDQLEAMQMLRPVPSVNLNTWDGDFLHAFDAFLGHRHAEAVMQLDAMIYEERLASAVRVASLLCMGKTDDAKLVLARLGTSPAEFLKSIAGISETRRVNPKIRAQLLDNLAPLKSW